MQEVDVVDESGNRVGSAEKLSVHSPPARLHRAVSVVLFDGDRALLQQRATTVYHFAGRWSNTCCTHPRPGEPPELAGRRRLNEELGITSNLQEVGTFVYLASDDDSGLVEFEFDHVLLGEFEGDPSPNPADVSAWDWVDLSRLQQALAADPQRYSPWLPHVIDIAIAARHG